MLVVPALTRVPGVGVNVRLRGGFLAAARFLPSTVSQPMIQMSRAVSVGARVRGFARAALIAFMLLAGGLSATLAGCCGNGPTHKCDFTPAPGSQDAGSPDGPQPCGQEPPCSDQQACCVTIAPLVARCVDPADFVRMACQKPEQTSCSKPADCPGGFICCLTVSAQTATGTVSCGAPQTCSSTDGMHLVICSSDSDCPSRASGACQPIGGAGAGTTVSVCN
jgi:hypothetical protein